MLLFWMTWVQNWWENNSSRSQKSEVLRRRRSFCYISLLVMVEFRMEIFITNLIARRKAEVQTTHSSSMEEEWMAVWCVYTVVLVQIGAVVVRFYGSAELFTPPATPSLRLISQTLGYGAADRVESGNICGIPAKKVYCWMALRWRFF